MKKIHVIYHKMCVYDSLAYLLNKPSLYSLKATHTHRRTVTGPELSLVSVAQEAVASTVCAEYQVMGRERMDVLL